MPPQLAMAGAAYTNGVSRPQTPMANSLSLTEYAANPSPPRDQARSRAQSLVPAAFLLPSGYPDVFVTALVT